MEKKIWCFSTPVRGAAECHPTRNYDWMLWGAELYRELDSTHELYVGVVKIGARKVCFETFPHAVACHLEGRVLSAKQKRRERPELLWRRGGVSTDELTNADWVDAGLCALTAHYYRERGMEYIQLKKRQ